MPWNPDTLLTQLTSILLDNAGSVRTVGANRFRGELSDALSDNAKGFLAGVQARAFLRMGEVTPYEQNYLLGNSRFLWRVPIDVVVVRHVSLVEKLDDAQRNDLQALAAQDFVVISAAVSYARGGGNLASTDLVSGILKPVRYRPVSIGEGNQIETVSTFEGIVREDLPTS